MEQWISARRSVAIEFEKNWYPEDHHGKVLSIDAVPALERDADFEIPDKVTGTWIKANPTKHREQATAKNKDLSGLWIPLVKMLKGWNRANGRPIKPSFLIEVMAEGMWMLLSPATRRRCAISSLGRKGISAAPGPILRGLGRRFRTE